MKVRILTVLVVLAVLVSSITSCTGTDSFLIKVMKLAPEGVGYITCADIEAMAEDPDLEDWHNDWIVELSYYAISCIETTDVSAFAGFEIDWAYVFVFMGSFDLEDIRDALEEEYFVEGECSGVEIWTGGFDEAIAFIDNMVVYGDAYAVEACIRTHKNEEPSLYDNEDMKAVADKLPSGVFSGIFGPDYIYSDEGLAGGMCLINLTRGDEVCDMNSWYKFDSKASAEDAIEDVEEDLSWTWGATNIETRLSGQFIEITAEVEISEY